MSGKRWWRGLQFRVTLLYTIGALFLTTIVAVGTYTIVQGQLLGEAEGQFRQQAYRNAVDVRQQLLSAAPLVEEGLVAAEPTIGPTIDEPTAVGEDLALDPEQEAEAEDAEDAAADIYNTILGELRVDNSLPVIVVADGSDRSLVWSIRNIPQRLKIAVDPPEGSEVESIGIAQLRYQDTDNLSYAIGVRLEDVEVTYYEVLPLDQVEGTLRSLRNILVGVAAAAAIGGALLGYYSARIALSPLSEISGAARSIAAGDFSTKLELAADQDLAVLTEAFNEMVDAVKDRIEREQRFTSDVSHELRSPLMTLTASVEILERRKDSLSGVAQQAVDLLSADLHRFQSLVEDLLEVSRMEAGAVQLQLSRFRIAEFLENVIYQSGRPYLELSYDPAAEMTSITADKRRLAQVVTNLLDNAEKYGNGASGVHFDVIGETVQIVVADSGPGVPANQRERIFERFGRVEAGNRQQASGFGLGLSLVAEHVRLHGGQVWVSDRVDGEKGARFVVQLPIGEHIDVLEEMAT